MNTQVIGQQTINTETVQAPARVKHKALADAALFSLMLSTAKGHDKFVERFDGFAPTLELLLTKGSNYALAYQPNNERVKHSVFWRAYHAHIEQVDAHNARIKQAKDFIKHSKQASKQAAALAEKLGTAFAAAASADEALQQAEAVALEKPRKYQIEYLCIKTMLDAVKTLNYVAACKTPEQLEAAMQAARAAYLLHAPAPKSGAAPKQPKTETEKAQASINQLQKFVSDHAITEDQFTQIENIYHALKARFTQA